MKAIPTNGQSATATPTNARSAKATPTNGQSATATPTNGRSAKATPTNEADAELAAVDRALLDSDEPTLAAAAATSDGSDTLVNAAGEKKSDNRSPADSSVSATNDTAHPHFILVD